MCNGTATGQVTQPQPYSQDLEIQIESLRRLILELGVKIAPVVKLNDDHCGPNRSLYDGGSQVSV